MSDERLWNARRNASFQHKIRGWTTSKEGIIYSYGITIPKNIANPFLDCKLIIHVSGNAIILESGCRTYAKEVRKNQEVNEGGTYLLVE